MRELTIKDRRAFEPWVQHASRADDAWPSGYSKTRRKAAAAAAVAALALAGCSGDTAEPGGSTTPPSAEERERELLADRTRLERASYECSDLGLSETFDDGRSLEAQIGGEDPDELMGGQPLGLLDCLIAEFDAPGSIQQRIEHTRALDGVQTAEWDGLTATWTYHPDAGLWLLIEEP
jgi:hypothetical protein